MSIIQKHFLLPFQKTTIYRETLSTIKEITELFNQNEQGIFRNKVMEESLSLTTTLTKALNETEPESQKKQFKDTINLTSSLIAILDTAETLKARDPKKLAAVTNKIYALQNKIADFKNKRKKILILYSQIGQGHISAAKALHEAITYLYGYDIEVESIDFMEFINSALTKVTQKTYDGSTKFAPVLCKLFFESTDKRWPITFLNKVNLPFVITKLKRFFDEKKPDIIVSTFPLWDHMTAEIWKKYRKNAKFISIVTDSITIHSAWVAANTDYHIVANEDTALSLKELGVKTDKIKILGFPVRIDFMQDFNKREFLLKNGLNPDLCTILFLPAAQNPRKNIKIMKDLARKQTNCNIIVITGRDPKVKPKLEKVANAPNIKVLGWTDEMPRFIRAANIVVTKAGGATVMECIAAKKPMIITFVIPGQEQGNAELIKRYGLGIIAPSTHMDISENINYVRENYETFIKRLEKVSNPQASIKIAEFIRNQIKD